jgi:hypothetical protein
MPNDCVYVYMPALIMSYSTYLNCPSGCPQLPVQVVFLLHNSHVWFPMQGFTKIIRLSAQP